MNELTELHREHTREALTAIQQIHTEAIEAVDAFVKQIFADESADQELVAELVCIRALRGLPLESASRVMIRIQERFQPRAQVAQGMLKDAIGVTKKLHDLFTQAQLLENELCSATTEVNQK